MLNIDSILQRIQMLIKQNELNASSFAEKIGVQRSSISHILSGRNKPSLEFLAKIEAAFDEVTFSWLLKGEKEKVTVEEIIQPTPTPTEPKKVVVDSDPTVLHKNSVTMHPIKVVHYYEDGSFESYHKR